MRHFRFLAIALGAFIVPAGFAAAQSTVDVLYQEFNAAKQQQADMSSQVTTNFFSQVDGAMGSPDAAVQLYQAAGGSMPDPAPVVTRNITESASEKEARLALDQSNVTKLGEVLELHLGLMHYGALFVMDPKREGLQDQWVAWLQKAAQLYPQIGALSQGDPNGTPGGAPRHHHQDAAAAGGGPPPPPPLVSLDQLKACPLSASIISKYLNFQRWNNADQGGWSVSNIPSLYKAAVLDPSRTPPTATTLANWDTYIAMANSDEKNQDTWNQVDYPPLAFGRAIDDYTIEPTPEKLEGLIKFAASYPNYPGVTDWLAQIKTLLDAYKAQHPSQADAAQAPANAPSGPATNSNITVTQVQQGDATIIITHTNSASATPPAH